MKLGKVMKELQRFESDIRFPVTKNTYLVEDRREQPYTSDLFINNAQVSLNTNKPLTYCPITDHLLEELLEDAEAGIITDNVAAQYAGLSIANARLMQYQTYLHYHTQEPPEHITPLAIQNMREYSIVLYDKYSELEQEASEMYDDLVREKRMDAKNAAIVRYLVDVYVRRIETGEDRR